MPFISPGHARALYARSGSDATTLRQPGWILGLLGASVPALAGPPYTVDDPGTLDHRGLFLYAAYIGSWLRGGISDTFPNLTLAYGLKPNLEISGGVSGFTSNVPASVPLAPLADPALAVKWRFREEERRSPALAVGYQVTLVTVDAGIGSGFVIHSVWLTGSLTIGRGQFWGNVGVNLYPRPALAGSVYSGLAYDAPVCRRLRLGAQLYGATALSRAGVPAELAWGAGATYSLFRNTELLLQAGRSLRGTHHLNLYAGVLTRLNR
jgi:hypothetical protein